MIKKLNNDVTRMILKVKRVLIVLGIGVCALYLAFSYFNYKLLFSEAKKGDFVFSEKIGWIGRTHANPKGPMIFLKKYRAKQFAINDTITYAQFWGYPALVNKILKVEKKYLVIKEFDNKTRDKLLFYVFKDVSEFFESTQGRIPFVFFKPRYSSSFLDGDLKGNLIGYYSAFAQADVDTIFEDLEIISKEAVVKKLENTLPAENIEWVMPNQNDFLSEFYETYIVSPDFVGLYLKEIKSTVNFQNDTQY